MKASVSPRSSGPPLKVGKRKEDGGSVPPRLLSRVRAQTLGALPEPIQKRARLWYYPDILTAGTFVSCGPSHYRFEQPVVLVFVDEEPGYGWAHPARLMVFEIRRGERLHQHPVHSPPHGLPEAFRAFEAPGTPRESSEQAEPKAGKPKAIRRPTARGQGRR